MYLWEASPPGLTGPLSLDVRRREKEAGGVGTGEKWWVLWRSRKGTEDP